MAMADSMTQTRSSSLTYSGSLTMQVTQSTLATPKRSIHGVILPTSKRDVACCFYVMANTDRISSPRSFLAVRKIGSNLCHFRKKRLLLTRDALAHEKCVISFTPPRQFQVCDHYVENESE